MVSIILNIIFIVVCILLILLIGLLFIPFDYIFEGYMNGNVYGKGIVKWLFGLAKFTIYKEKDESDIRVKFNLCGLRIPIKKVKHKNFKKKEKKKYSKKKIQITKELIRICYEYIKDIINIVKPKYINVSGVYGFEDPSITGIVCGVISVINSVIPSNFINVQPDFEEELYDINVKISGRIILCIILFRTLKFIMKKEVRKNIFSKKEKNVKPSKA